MVFAAFMFICITTSCNFTKTHRVHIIIHLGSMWQWQTWQESSERSVVWGSFGPMIGSEMISQLFSGPPDSNPKHIILRWQSLIFKDRKLQEDSFLEWHIHVVNTISLFHQSAFRSAYQYSIGFPGKLNHNLEWIDVHKHIMWPPFSTCCRMIRVFFLLWSDDWRNVTYDLFNSFHPGTIFQVGNSVANFSWKPW